MAIHARELIETWLWLALGFLIAAVPPLLFTGSMASYGRPQAAPFVADLALLLAFAAAGLLAGRAIPWLLAAPVSAIATYVLLGLLVTSAVTVADALTPVDTRGRAFCSVPTWVPIAQVALWLLLSAAVVLRRAGRPRPVLVAVWLAGVAAAPLLYVGDADREPDDRAARLTCTNEDSNVSVCLPQVKAYLAPQLIELLGEVQPVLQGLVPDRIAVVDDEARGVSAAVDAGIEQTAVGQASDGRSVLLLSAVQDLSATTQLDRDTFLTSFALAVFPTTVDEMAAEPPLTTQAAPSDVLQRWFLQTLHVPIDGSTGPGAPILDGTLFSFSDAMQPLRWLEGLTAQERTQWFRGHRTQIANGQLALCDFN